MMSSARTLPDALARAADSGTGLTFVVDGVETHRSYAELRRRCAFRGAWARRARAEQRRPGRDCPRRRRTISHRVVWRVVERMCSAAAVTARWRRFATLSSVDRPGAARVECARGHHDCRTAAAARARPRELPGNRAAPVTLQSLRAEPLENGHAPHLDDLAFVQFTSGSSSAPKEWR